MTPRKPCLSAPGPLETYAEQFDDLFGHRAQRQGFREYLLGLLLPRERRKTLTGVIGTEPVVGAQAPAVQRLQSFLSESGWDAEAINQRRLELLQAAAPTTTHEQGVLIIDDTGDRKSGNQTAYVGRQYLGSIGKIDNGLVVVSSLWAAPQRYYPLHAAPYTPARRLPKRQQDPAFRTKPQLAVQLIQAALETGILFRAVVADSLYGENSTFVGELFAEGLPYVVSVKPSEGIWAPVEAAHTPQEAAEELHWNGPSESGEWQRVVRQFRDGHTEVWWAAELTYGPYGPQGRVRRLVATTDPFSLPATSTWYVETNLPAPAPTRAEQGERPTAPVAEIVGLYGLRHWGEQGYKQVKTELGWTDAQVRSTTALRRHWLLIFCAFTFCWCHWLTTSRSAPSPALSPASEGKRPMAAWAPWPVTLRRVRSWLSPWRCLQRWWAAWTSAAPPPALQALLDRLTNGYPLNLYLAPD